MNGDVEKGLDDSSDPTRLSLSETADDTRPQSPHDQVADSEPAVPYGPQSVIVDWDGPQDPEHPQNWNLRYKWCITMVMVRNPTLYPDSIVQHSQRSLTGNAHPLRNVCLFDLQCGCRPDQHRI